MRRVFGLETEFGITVNGTETVDVVAAEFVKLASQFKSDVQLSKDGMDVNGKSIMGVMTLAAECGSHLTIRTHGDDAEAALEALAALVAKGFSEVRES